MAYNYQTRTLYEQGVFWDGDRPYNKREDGSKEYIKPIAAAASQDPKLQAWAKSQGASIGEPGGTLASGQPKDRGMFRTTPQFDQSTGKWADKFDWGTVAGLGALAPFAVAGGVAAAGAIGAGGGGGGAAATMPAAYTAVPPSVAAGTVEGAAATGGSMGAGFFSKAVPWIQPASTLVGGIVQNKANNKALDSQERTAAEALAYAKEQDRINRELEQTRYNEAKTLEQTRYDTARADKAPYRQISQGALQTLDQLRTQRFAPITGNDVRTWATGGTPKVISMADMRSAGTGQTPAAAVLSPRASMVQGAPVRADGAVSAQDGSGRLLADAGVPTGAAEPMVTLQGPDGSTKQMPASEAKRWLDMHASAGVRVVA